MVVGARDGVLSRARVGGWVACAALLVACGAEPNAATPMPDGGGQANGDGAQRDSAMRDSASGDASRADTGSGGLCGNGIVDVYEGETCDGDCPMSCVSVDPCVPLVLVGDASLCTSDCVISTISACNSADGCCPSTCLNDGGGNSDTDCPLIDTCGNGVLDLNELCDDGNGSATPCPSSCVTNDACTTSALLGDASSCTARCVDTSITTIGIDDGCCPFGGDASNDSDCLSECGNGVVEPSGGETCDSTCPTSCPTLDACAPQTLIGDATVCTSECVAGAAVTACTSGDGCCPSTCVNDGSGGSDDDCPQSSLCGNGAIDANEFCDDGNGSPTPCPTSCTPSGSCKAAQSLGASANCTARCIETDIIAVGPSDACCPSGANATNDDDCSASCGNGVIEPSGGETCEASCPTSCTASDACMPVTLVGSASACTSACVVGATITTCASGDGCCPSTCHNDLASGSDTDCPVSGVCGNGQIDASEFCDDGNGSPTPCPTNCTPSGSCKAAQSVGSSASCTARCIETDITAIGPSDGCCPSGGNATNDSDCSAVCGNGVIEPSGGETCETSCPTSCTASDACMPLMLVGSVSACTSECVAAAAITSCVSGDGCCPSACHNDLASGSDTDCPVSGACGNGQLDANEFCDNGNGSPTPCPTTCTPTAPCKAAQLMGSSGTCTARCVETNITAVGPSDGCCPSGANATNDSDCDPVCGNGVVESPEKCDSNCPTSCGAGVDACNPQVLSGTGCARECIVQPITQPANNDGCCPAAANPGNDNDCACPGTQTNCGGCVDTATNSSHCGGCGQACSSNHIGAVTCAGSACTGACSPGFADCNLDKLGDGCEVTLATDNANCGACGNVCPGFATCMAGKCRCSNGQLACGGSCVDEQVDANNCGGCGQVCSSNHMATRTCAAGNCNGACASGYANCNFNKLTDGCELDVRTDINNCGACGTVCSSMNVNPSCTNQTCGGQCLGWYADCDGMNANGCEINISTDPNHCGACSGKICSNQGVQTRSCAIVSMVTNQPVCTSTCLPGYADCDNDKLNNGCEIYMINNPSHCGQCNRLCNTVTQICQVNLCKLKNGESCTTNFQCASNRCSFNVCVPP